MKVEGRPHGLKTQAGREGRHLTCKFNSQRRKTDNTRQMRKQGARKEDSEQSSQTLGQEKEEESRTEVRRELPLESWSISSRRFEYFKKRGDE